MKKFSIEFKWAAIATLAAMIWVIFVKSLGFHSGDNIRYVVGFDLLFNLILIVFYYLGIREKKREFYHGVISWQRAFFTGLVMCVFITMFFPIVQYITFNQLSPSFITDLQNALVSSGNATAIESASTISFDMFIRNGFTNNLSFGIVITAIVAYFIQTKDQETLKNAAVAKPEVVKVKKNKKDKQVRKTL